MAPTKRKYLNIKRRKRRGLTLKSLSFKNLEQTRKREAFRIQPSGLTLSGLKKYVLEMQMKLAVAIRNQDIGSINLLISKILRSNLTRYWAVYKTISSSGAKSKGIGDTKIPTTNSEYTKLYNQLWEAVKHPRTYKASPLKRIWIPKPNSTEYRPISVPSYLDRAYQHLYLIILDVFQEETAERNSFGFRSHRSPGWASKAVTLYIWSRKKFQPPKFAIELDIRKCFDTMNHDFIMKHVGKVKIIDQEISVIHPCILNQWLKSGHIDVLGTITPKHQTVPTEMGIAQGGPISPTMANMVLNGIETVVKECSIQPPPKKLQVHIKPEDKIIWSFNNEELFCTFGLGESNYNIINQTLRDMNLSYPSKAFARNFLTGVWPHTRDGWSYKYVNANNSMEIFRNSKNNNETALFRFADDCIIFANSQEACSKILDSINTFLIPRGLEINKNKTHIRNLHDGDKFTFVGFEFAILRKHGKWKVYNYPPNAKIVNLKKKVNEVLKTYKTKPYLAFYSVNAIIRGWCNFYSCGNSKTVFSEIRKWIWHKIYRYLVKFYKFDSKYRIKSQRFFKKLLSKDIFLTNLSPAPYSPSGAKWWSIPPKFIPQKSGRFIVYEKPYFLIDPGYIEVSTPKIITGLSSYFPSERLKLIETSINWKKGLRKTLLLKSKGLCKNCGCSLLDQNETMEIHHIQPKAFGGRAQFTNLALLCKECHKEVTAAVASKNLEQILIYEQSKILADVSSLIKIEEQNNDKLE